MFFIQQMAQVSGEELRSCDNKWSYVGVGVGDTVTSVSVLWMPSLILDLLWSLTKWMNEDFEMLLTTSKATNPTFEYFVTYRIAWYVYVYRQNQAHANKSSSCSLCSQSYHNAIQRLSLKWPTCNKFPFMFASTTVRHLFWYHGANAGLTSLIWRTSVLYGKNRYMPLAKCESSKIWCYSFPVWFIWSSSFLVWKSRNFLIWQLLKCINSKRNMWCNRITLKPFHIEHS